jgi:ubiquinone/menaquinone biosynthesis C-methylase UbiE
MAGYKFDYETKVWGGEKLRVSPIHFRASRLYFALQELKNKKGKLLDVGCGAGDFIEAFSFYLPKLDFTGIDISKKAIDRAKSRKIKAKFLVSEAEKIPFKDNFFDMVTCFDVLEHVKNPMLMVKEMHRVLKVNGTFQAFIPTEDNIFSPEGLLIKLGWRAKEIYGGHPHHYSREYILKLLKDAGFRINKIKYGEHFTNQIIEILYFSYLSIRGKNTDVTVEGYLAKNKKGFGIYILNFLKNLFSTISYFEARLLCNLPGGLGIHLTCTKK